MLSVNFWYSAISSFIQGENILYIFIKNWKRKIASFPFFIDTSAAIQHVLDIVVQSHDS